MHEDNEGRLDAAERLAERNLHTAAEAFSAIACDQEAGGEVRLSAAAQLAAADPRAAAPAGLAIACDGGSVMRCAYPLRSLRPSTSALEPAATGRRTPTMNDSLAEPLDRDDEHEVIRGVDQERDESRVCWPICNVRNNLAGSAGSPG
jgi:hypothetical protein